MKIAYLVGIYPRVTHSFIRREIRAVEESGLQVERFSIRFPEEELVDKADLAELDKTHFLLDSGILGLFIALLKVFLQKPFIFFEVLIFTLQIGLKSDRGIPKHLAYLGEACIMLAWCAKLEIDHIHAHFGTNASVVSMLCKALGGPSYSFTVHGPEEFDRVESIALPEKIERAAFVVAISTFAKSHLYRWCSYKDYAKIHIIRCGVDKTFLGTQFQPIPDAPRLACVGRLCTHKAQLLIIEATSCLVAEGMDFQVTLVGGGPLQNELEQLIDRLKLRNYITITGWADSSVVQRNLLESRVMILPSFAEGLPVVIMESLGLGRPVITTYVAGVPELVESGKCGWVITPGDFEGLKHAMREALKSSVNELEEMGRNGAHRVAKMHDASKEGSKLAELFQKYDY